LEIAIGKVLNVGGRLLKNPEEFRAGEDMPYSILIHFDRTGCIRKTTTLHMK